MSGPVEAVPPQTVLQPPVANRFGSDEPATSAQKPDEDHILSSDIGLQDGEEVPPLPAIE